MVIELLAGGGLVLLGAAIGRWMPGRHRYHRPRSIRPICGCEHHHSFHDPKTGECHGLMDGNPIKYDTWKDPTAYEQVPCTCRQYSGPEPLPEMYAREIASE